MKSLKITGKNLFKSLIKPYYNSESVVKIRNKLGFRIVPILLPENLPSYSASDAFPWRIDDGYKTHFRFSDILKNYYNIDGNGYKFVFYSNNGDVLKEIVISNLDNINELVIDNDFIPCEEEFGNFSIFHLFESNIENIKILNRCYVGFAKDDSIPSYVHGNVYTRYWNPTSNKIESGIIKLTQKVHNYLIQKNFGGFDKIELYFTNQTNSKYWIIINDAKIILNMGQSIIVDVKPCETIHIKSNNFWARPIVFTEKNNFIDCFHA
jgi:hypothetical protein